MIYGDIFNDITEETCIKDRYPVHDSEDSNCARLRGIPATADFLYKCCVWHEVCIHYPGDALNEYHVVPYSVSDVIVMMGGSD